MSNLFAVGRRISQWLLGATLVATLAACGGGGGSGGTPVFDGGSGGGTGGTGGGTTSPTMTVSISSTAVTAAAPGTVTAVLKDATGSAMAGQLVTFSTKLGLGVFSANSALTDSTGTATVTVTPASSTSNGADFAVATATVGSGTGTTVTGQVGFTTTATTVPAASFTITLSTQTITAASPATVSAKLSSATGAAISGQVVTFTTGTLGTFSPATALTDGNGVATTTLYPASTASAGADTVTASVTASGAALTAAAGYQVNATAVTIASFTSDVASGTSLAAYGQANLSLALTGTVSTTPVNVSVTSQCLALSTPKAKLTPASTSTTTGTASFTYVDQGCGAVQTSDTVTVTAGSVTSTLTIPLTSPTVATMTFVSASPSTLFLSTSGSSPQSSVVTFQLSDQNGTGVPGKSVALKLTTLVGGITIDGQSTTISKQTNSLGQVSVQVNSGTVPTPVRVVASYDGPTGTISSSSSNLSIAVGLPSQSRFSLSQQQFNIEAYNVDLTPNTYNIITSDRLGNPVPSATAINLVNTMGQVLTQPVTGSSSAISTVSVVSASGGQRPFQWDGRVTTLAYAIGEMSFKDTDANNAYTSSPTAEDYQDLGDPYLDPKFRGFYDSSLQTFAFGSSASCPAPVSNDFKLYDELNGSVSTDFVNATVPAKPGTCLGHWGQSFVRSAIQTVWSTSRARPSWGPSLPADVGTVVALSSAACPVTHSLIDHYQATAAGDPVYTNVYDVNGTTIKNLTSSTLTFFVADANPYAYNPMAAGTTVTVAAAPAAALTASIVGGGTVGNSLSPTPVTATWSFNTGFSTGSLIFTITSPVTKTTTSVAVKLFAGDTPGAGGTPPDYVTCP